MATSEKWQLRPDRGPEPARPASEDDGRPGRWLLQGYDRQTEINWGGRAGSAALTELLQASSATVALLPATLQTGWAPAFGHLLPERMRAGLSASRLAARVLGKAERALGANLSLIQPDPHRSADNLLRHAGTAPIGSLVDAVEACDTLVIDGNGHMIFKSRASSYLRFDLALLELARRLGTPAYYVNAVVADCPVNGRNDALADRCSQALEACRGVAVRDRHSLALARSIAPAAATTLIPDSLFAWQERVQSASARLVPDFFVPTARRGPAHAIVSRNFVSRMGAFDEPYVCVTGGSRAAWSKGRAAKAYGALVRRLQALGLPVYLVPTCGGDDFLYDVSEQTGAPAVPAEVPVQVGAAILANARLFVSGRYHPSILAALGGTPTVFLGADSHKTLSLQGLLGYDRPHVFSAIPSGSESDAIAERGAALIEEGGRRRDRIERAARRCASRARRITEFVRVP